MISFHRSRDFEKMWEFSKGWETAQLKDLGRVRDCITKCVWSPCTWKDGHRLEENFLSSHYCGFDFESPEFTWDDALRAFCDLKYVIAPTKSHRKPKGQEGPCDRFRVVVPWEHPITDLRTYRYNMELLSRRYDMDRACIDGARLFFPCVGVSRVHYGEYSLDVETPPNSYQITARGPRIKQVLKAKKEGVIPKWTLRMLSSTILVGHRSTCFYQVTKDLAFLGYSSDEIRQLILDSPTYRGGIDPHASKKLDEAIRSGMKRAAKDLAEYNQRVTEGNTQ